MGRFLNQSTENIKVGASDNTFSCTTDITVTFTVPSGFAIWPNNTAPYTSNEIQLALSDTGDNPYSITMANAAEGGSGAATEFAFAGSALGNNTRIICMDLTARGDGTLAFSITGHSGHQDSAEVTFSGVIMPRNFRQIIAGKEEEEV